MKKILIVDDNKPITDMMKLMLELEGYHCTVANSGQECFDLIRSNKFDLVFLDIGMPEVSGIDILNKVMEDPILSNNRIVFVTAFTLADDTIDHLKSQGALDCIQKPVSTEKLLEVVAKCAK